MKNVALFGAGRIGRIHGSNIAALPGVTLKYVCDPVGDSAAQLAAQLGATVSTPDAVFADPSIDVVAVASLTDTHSDMINRAATRIPFNALGRGNRARLYWIGTMNAGPP